MSWAAKRRLIILLIVGALAAAIFALFSFSAFYEAPSCSDSIQNQDEAGIDCGGSCAYLCTAQMQPPTVLYVSALPGGEGRTDVVALIENKNADAAAKAVPYRIILYGSGQALIQETSGTIDIPPGAAVPVYVPSIFSGKQKVMRAFLTIDSEKVAWFSMPQDTRTIPLVSNITQVPGESAPRIEATLTNPSVYPLSRVRIIVIVHGASGDVMTASQTIISAIPAQGQSAAVFTWNEPFASTPTSIEVIPVIPLP